MEATINAVRIAFVLERERLQPLADELSFWTYFKGQNWNNPAVVAIADANIARVVNQAAQIAFEVILRERERESGA